MNKTVAEVLDSTIESLQSDDRIQTYKTLQNLIQQDGTLNDLWETQKQIQKELVHAKTYHLTNQMNDLDAKLKDVALKLENHPLMQAYNDAHREIVALQKEIEEIVFE